MRDKNSVALIYLFWAIVLVIIACGINNKINSKKINSLSSEFQQLEEVIDNENP